MRKYFGLSTAFSVLMLISASRVLATEVSIDFGVCKPETRRVGLGLGSTTYEIIGKSKFGCVMLFGGEIENPRWDGFLDTICLVPVDLGKSIFPTTNTGVNFSSLQKYCGPTPRAKK